MFAGASFCPPRLPGLLVTVVVVVSAMSRGAGMASTPSPPPGTGNGAGPAAAAGVGTQTAGAAVGATGVRTGILIHGCHLGAKRWRNIMWGDERLQRLGRLPHGVKLAWEERACVVVLGTGASERDGVLEGRYALDYLMSHWERLRDFREAFAGLDTEDIRSAVQPILVAEVRSQNTRQELQEAGRLFRKENCDRVILVSSPTHLPRCLRDACSLWLDDYDAISGDTLDNGEERRASDLPPVGTGGGDRRHELPIAAKSPYASVGNVFSLTAAGRVAMDGTDRDRSEAEADGGTDAEEEEEIDGEERERGRRMGRSRRRPWRPVILASPSGTNYADYGAADVAVVEPPHRGDSAHVMPNGGSSNGDSGGRPRVDPTSKTSEETRREVLAKYFSNREWTGRKGRLHSNGVPRTEKNGAPPPLLHELVALALKIDKGREEDFRREFQALLRRYVDVE